MILCSGCFDGVHAGHAKFLEVCESFRQPTDWYKGCPEGKESLVVAVAPDAYIRRVKGREPRWSLSDRMGVIRAMFSGSLDVMEHGDQGVASVILEGKPRLFVKGEDWVGRLEPDVLEACRKVGAQIVYVGSYQTQHSAEAWA